MLTRKFKNKGGWVYNGKPLDMYQLALWIRRYNRENGAALTPTTITEEHAAAFVADVGSGGVYMVDRVNGTAAHRGEGGAA